MDPTSADELDALVNDWGERFRGIDEAVASAALETAWSCKQVLGHLIDSAANNHQRFVRLQHATGLDLPGYEQERWVASQQYDQEPWADVVDLWTAYNRHLAHVIRNIPESALGNSCTLAGQRVTLQFIVEDYLRHMRHHLNQIAGRAGITG